MSASGQALHGWKGAGKLFWSFLWRQVIALALSSLLVGLFIGALRQLGLVRPVLVFDVMPFLTTSLVAFSCVASFRSLLSKYDVRSHAHHAADAAKHHRR